MNGLAGAELVAGKGRGGLGEVGVGLGGGGTGIGQIQGSGSLDFGSGRGRGRKGPNLGRGQEKEVKVGMETGNPDSSGGLSREQINRVVKAHAAAIRYCFEKELQRQPDLAGKIELYWLIKPRRRGSHQGGLVHHGQQGGGRLHGAAGAQLAVPALGQRHHRPELSVLLLQGGRG